MRNMYIKVISDNNRFIQGFSAGDVLSCFSDNSIHYEGLMPVTPGGIEKLEIYRKVTKAFGKKIELPDVGNRIYKNMNYQTYHSTFAISYINVIAFISKHAEKLKKISKNPSDLFDKIRSLRSTTNNLKAAQVLANKINEAFNLISLNKKNLGKFSAEEIWVVYGHTAKNMLDFIPHAKEEFEALEIYKKVSKVFGKKINLPEPTEKYTIPFKRNIYNSNFVMGYINIVTFIAQYAEKLKRISGNPTEIFEKLRSMENYTHTIEDAQILADRINKAFRL
ncbi:MAG: hypothetical protein KKA19_00250 [Candidatus Margulisbacteria bacterium]|nr:hypothetical protein [Candidatus Margulisiibacteriota bacterium]